LFLMFGMFIEASWLRSASTPGLSEELAAA